MNVSDCEIDAPATSSEVIKKDEIKIKKESPMPESSDDDGSYFDFDIDDFADFDEAIDDVKDDTYNPIEKDSPMPESSDDDGSYFDFDIDDFADFDEGNHDVKDDAYNPIDIHASFQPQAINNDENKEESPIVPDLSFDQEVQVQLPLRRSTRIAERRERQKLQIDSGIHQETDNTTTLTTGIHSAEPSPDILGSIFVEGRRRSARTLVGKSRKTVDS